MTAPSAANVRPRNELNDKPDHCLLYILVNGEFFFTKKMFFEVHCRSNHNKQFVPKKGKKKMRENSQMRHSKNNQYDIMEKREKGL